MKKHITTLFAVLLSAFVAAQNPQMYSVHEDVVKPSMTAKYRELLQKLKAVCEQHKLNFTWITVSFDDNVFRHMAPIKTMADLDKNPFADLETKMGKEALGKLWSDFGNCLEGQMDYVNMYLPELSYLAPLPEETFREITFWTVEPGKEAEAESIMKEWKKLYEAKKAPNGFVTFRALLGKEYNFTVASWGKDELDHATKAAKTRELLGEEGDKLWERTMSITRKYDTKRAWIMPGFSYSLAGN